ncbi:MAG: hypothetical protein AAGA37_19825 [Actinomycetota bacterium]
MIVLFVAAGMAALIGAVLGVRWWTWRPVVKQRVMVKLVDGPSISGVCMSRRGPLLVLEDATLHADGQQLTADGQTILDRDRVMWIQVIS